MDSKKKLFSIVVPMYNVEKYLNECLDSLVNQTSKNFVVYLIDDGSKDSTASIAKSYVEKYPDLFEYHYQENKGLGGARNTGISKIKTEYSIFLDSDDFIATRTIEYLTKLVGEQTEKPDIILTAPTIYNSITKAYSPFYDNADIERIFAGKEYTNVQRDAEILSLEASFWRCVWRTEFLDKCGQKFQEHVAWEDVPLHFILFHKAKRIIKYSYFPTFYYRINTGGQITSGTGKTRLDVPVVFGEVISTMQQNNWPLIERAHVINVMQKFVCWSLSVVNEEYRPEFVRLTHLMYKTITHKEFSAYKKYINPSFKLKTIFKAFRSNCLYKTLADASKVKRISMKYEKLKAKVKKMRGK